MKKCRIVVVLVVISLLLSLVGCGAKCKNGCGSAADPSCMAGMCDNCCDYWCGLNGCYKNH